MLIYLRILFETFYFSYIFLVTSFLVSFYFKTKILYVSALLFYFFYPSGDFKSYRLNFECVYRIPAFLICMLHIVPCDNVCIFLFLSMVSFVSYFFLIRIFFYGKRIPNSIIEKAQWIWYNPRFYGENIRTVHIVGYFSVFFVLLVCVFAFIGFLKSFDLQALSMALLSVYVLSNLCLDAFNRQYFLTKKHSVNVTTTAIDFIIFTLFIYGVMFFLIPY